MSVARSRAKGTEEGEVSYAKALRKHLLVRAECIQNLFPVHLVSFSNRRAGSLARLYSLSLEEAVFIARICEDLMIVAQIGY